MVNTQSVLIIANSARMLTQKASNLGFCVCSIDCYADCDTQKLAKKCIRVDSLALDQVTKALETLSPNFNISYVIYGSGLEQFQDTLAFLSAKFTLIGNTPDVFVSVQNKVNFYSKLKHLQIPYPETTFHPPEQDGDWLIKPVYGQGGIGIERYINNSKQLKSGCWQRYIDGISMSALFVADGSNFQLIGFNKQLKAAGEEFVFSGVISQPEVSDHIRETVTYWLAILVKEFVLRGVNSLDFIVSNTQCLVLEINPRPSASMQLYSDDWLKVHLNSFLTAKLESINDSINCHVYKIIFAKTDCYIKEGMNWPEWVTDIPFAGSIVHIGMPICSIIAQGINEQQVEEILQIREQKLSKLLR